MATIETLNNWESWSVIRGKLNTNFSNLNTDKVDKVTWKGLSTNDYDNTEKAKVDWAVQAIVAWTNITVSRTWNSVTINSTWWGGGGSWPVQHRITIPWEQVADTANYQWLYWYNDTWVTKTISNVAFAVGKAAAYNIYKSSWTAADWLNTNAVALFSSAVNLWTWYTSLTNTPNTATVEAGRWVTLRCTSSAWATNRASDLQCIITFTS